MFEMDKKSNNIRWYKNRRDELNIVNSNENIEVIGQVSNIIYNKNSNKIFWLDIVFIIRIEETRINKNMQSFKNQT